MLQPRVMRENMIGFDREGCEHFKQYTQAAHIYTTFRQKLMILLYELYCEARIVCDKRE